MGDRADPAPGREPGLHRRRGGVVREHRDVLGHRRRQARDLLGAQLDPRPPPPRSALSRAGSSRGSGSPAGPVPAATRGPPAARRSRARRRPRRRPRTGSRARRPGTAPPSGDHGQEGDPALDAAGQDVGVGPVPRRVLVLDRRDAPLVGPADELEGPVEHRQRDVRQADVAGDPVGLHRRQAADLVRRRGPPGRGGAGSTGRSRRRRGAGPRRGRPPRGPPGCRSGPTGHRPGRAPG